MLFVSHVLLVGITLLLKNEEANAILKKSTNFKGYVNKDMLMKLIDVINENEGDRTNVDKEIKGLGLKEPNYLGIMKQLQKNYDYKEMADIKDKTEARIHIIENPEVLNDFLAELDRKDQPTPEDLPSETKSHRRRGNFRGRRRHLFRRRHHDRRYNSKRRNVSSSKHQEKRFGKYSRENDGGKKKRFERRDRFGRKDKYREDSRENNKEKTIDKKDKYRGYSKENNNDKKKRPYDSKWSDKKDKNVGYSRENNNKKKRVDDSWFDKKTKYTDYSRENDNNKKKRFDGPKRFDKKDRADSKEKFSKKEQFGDKVNVREKYDVRNKSDDRKKRSDSREKKTIRSRVDDFDYNNGVATTKNAFRESILTVDLASIEENIKIPAVDSYYPSKLKTKDWLDFENRKPLDKVKNDDDWGKPLKNDDNWDKPMKNDNNWDKPIKNDDNWDKPIKNNDNWDKPIKNNDNWDKPIKNNDNWDRPIKNNDNWDKPIKNNDDWEKPIKNNDNWGKPIKADDNWGKPMNDMANPGAPMPQNDLDWGERLDVKIINPQPMKSYEDDMEKGGQERTRDSFNKYASTTKSQNNDWGRPAVKFENKYKYNMERLYDYEYQPKRKPINRDGYGFGRTPIPYIGKKGVYAEN